MLVLRDSEVQNLFDGYFYDGTAMNRKKMTSYTTSVTSHTEPETFYKIDIKK